MKKSEFKKQIQNEILDILKEADAEDIKAQQDLNKELELSKSHADELGDALSEGNDSDKFQDDGYVNHTYDDSVIDKYNVPVEPTAVFEEDDEDKEPTSSQLKSEPISKIGYELADTNKKMKQIVKKWSATEEGPAKDKLKDRLRELTKIKKELENLLENKK